MATRRWVKTMETPQDLQQIESDFPGWGVWRSDTSRWWAFRTARNPLTIDQLRAGCRLIVQADTYEDLRAEIRSEILRAV